MKVGILYSGGKDSNFATFLASKEHDIKCLISMKSANLESYMFQSIGNEIVKLQSVAMNIPLIHFETKGEKEKELEDLKSAIIEAVNKYEIEGIVTGAIKSTYQASRVQKICNELDLWCFNPLWQINEEKFLEKLIENEFDVRIIAIAAYPLTDKILNRKIDLRFIEEVGKVKGISIAGEGGEYESFVLDSPLFKKKISIDKFDIKMDSENSGNVVIKEVKLVEK